MYRLPTLVLLAFISSPFFTSVRAAPQDMRVDPRGLVATTHDLPASFTTGITMFSINRYGPLYFGKYGSINFTALYRAGAGSSNGAALIVGVSSYQSANDASAICCSSTSSNRWTNKTKAFQIPPIGQAGYSQRTGPDANGRTTDTIEFVQDTSVITLRYIRPSAVSGHPQALTQDQFYRLARALDIRATTAPKVPIASLVPVLIPVQGPTRIARPTISNLGLNVDVSMSLAVAAGVPALSLSAFAPQGATCTPTLSDSTGHGMAVFSHGMRIIPAGDSIMWSWPATATPIAGTAAIFCGQGKLSGAAEVSYLLTR
jgi:hypothetical protein